MKKQKIISAIILMFILFNFIFSLIPVGITKSYAADCAAGTLARDIDGIDDTLYPGYKSLIKTLQAKNPNYVFLAYYTGMDWNQVVNAEYQGHGNSPLNLFQVGSNYNGMWMCPICSNKEYDNGSWCCASKEAIAYMMDPRNSINESDIFQFKDLEGSDVSYDDIARVVANYGSYLNNQEVIQAIVDASKEYNVNGYFLVAKIINEHGKDGSTLSNGQGYSGNYVGIYNYFNIGAFGNGSAAIINNGLSYAHSQGWTSRRASIFGGAKVVKESYIKEYSQNTLYYQKFNVSGRSSIGSHQYQQNIMAAQSQGTSLKKYYEGSNTVQSFTFIIPLYKNMPVTICNRPDVTTQNSITYEDGVVTNVSTALIVRASASINGVAIGKLNNNESIKILQRAINQVDGYYWDLIVSNIDGTYGYAARIVDGDNCISSTGTTGSSSGTVGATPPLIEEENDNIIEEKAEILFEENVMKSTPSVTFEHIKEKSPNAIVKKPNGEEVVSGKIGTGYTITVGEKTYTVVKKGDVNGDGNVNVTDARIILNYIKEITTLENATLEAAKVNNRAEVNISDARLLLNYIKGVANIEI